MREDSKVAASARIKAYDEAYRSVPGRMAAKNRTAANSNVREFHVERKCEMYSLNNMAGGELRSPLVDEVEVIVGVTESGSVRREFWTACSFNSDVLHKEDIVLVKVVMDIRCRRMFSKNLPEIGTDATRARRVDVRTMKNSSN
jgi:hypothetical protein